MKVMKHRAVEFAKECPDVVLGETAIDEWLRLRPDVAPLDVKLTTEETTTLAAYCVSLGRWHDAEHWIKENGTTIVFRDKDGRTTQVMPAPQVSIAAQSMKAAAGYAGALAKLKTERELRSQCQ